MIRRLALIVSVCTVCILGGLGACIRSVDTSNFSFGSQTLSGSSWVYIVEFVWGKSWIGVEVRRRVEEDPIRKRKYFERNGLWWHVRHGAISGRLRSEALVSTVFAVESELLLFAAVLFAVHPLFALLRGPVRRWERRRRGLCPMCAYDLTGNVSGVCPECGKPIPEGAKTPGDTTLK